MSEFRHSEHASRLLEAEREELLSRLQLILDRMPIACLLNDQEFRFVYWNPAAERIFGYSFEEVRGELPFGFITPTSAQPLVENVFRRLEAGEQLPDITAENITKDGRTILCVWSNTPIRLPDGTFGGIVSMCQDITERAQAEEVARQTQARLIEQQQREKELVEAELAKIRAELVRNTRLAAIGRMAAGIAHDLRNPLGTIRNAAYLMRKKGRSDELSWNKYLTMIEQEVTASDRIIANLLEVTRPKEPLKQLIDLGEVVRASFERFGPPPAVDCVFSSVPEPFHVNADPIQMRQVFDNLIKNSLDAVAGSGTVRVDASKIGEYAIVMIQDDGCGISGSDRDVVFEPLFSTKSKGTGLGLWICRQILERHGGSIDLMDLQERRGAAFRLHIPGAIED